MSAQCIECGTRTATADEARLSGAVNTLDDEQGTCSYCDGRIPIPDLERDSHLRRRARWAASHSGVVRTPAERQARHRARVTAEAAQLRKYASDAAAILAALLDTPEGQQLMEAPGIRAELRGLVVRGRLLAGER